MLPVTTKPPRRPGAWGSPFGRPRQIDLSRHDDPHQRPGHHLFVLAKGAWIVKCGMTNTCKLTYKILDDDDLGHLDGDDHPLEPWNQKPIWGHPPPEWGRPPFPPKPSNDVMQETLVESNKTGSVFADGQNVTIEGSGKATIIQVFSV